MRKLLMVLMLILIAALPAGTASAEQAALPSPTEVISLINQYRQQNGLSALAYNPLLASLAQQQSDYQAQVGYVTHEGPGGTTPQQRAAAAGYSSAYLSEIIYGGMSATPSAAMTWWKNSSVHNYYILHSNYSEIGAGVATDGTSTYFTAVLGGSGGVPAAPTATVDPSAPTAEPGAPAPTTEPFAVVIPVTRSTPHPDGTIHHIVQQGQTLWVIAAIYETTTDKIIELNGLESTFIFPGNDLIISLTSDPPTATPPTPTLSEPTQTSTIDSAPESKTPTSDSPPQGEITPMLGIPFSLVVEQTGETPESTNTPAPVSIQTNTEKSTNFLGGNPIVSTLVIAAAVILVLVVVVSGFMQIKPGRPPRDDLVK